MQAIPYDTHNAEIFCLFKIRLPIGKSAFSAPPVAVYICVLTLRSMHESVPHPEIR